MPDQPFIVQKSRKRRGRTKTTKKSGVYLTPASWTPSGPGGTRESVIKAAEIFRDQARKSAARFSTRIPPATDVQAFSEQEAMVVTDGTAAPNAAPFEFGLRHPLWGRWDTPGPTHVQPKRPYMSRAATNSGAITRAKEIYQKIEADLLAQEYGYDQ